MALIKILEGRQSIPEITHIFNYNDPTYLQGGGVPLRILGYSFEGIPGQDPTNNIFNAYISCNDSTAMFNRDSEAIDKFKNITNGGDKSLSVLFPEFTGFEVTYNILSQNIVIVNIPPIYRDGCFDIILLNRAGYTRSSQALGSYACTTDAPLNFEAPVGILKQTGENILSQKGSDILINRGANKIKENSRRAGDIACEP